MEQSDVRRSYGVRRRTPETLRSAARGAEPCVGRGASLEAEVRGGWTLEEGRARMYVFPVWQSPIDAPACVYLLLLGYLLPLGDVWLAC